MKLKNILVKMANRFDERGEFELANEIDSTLGLIEEQELISDPSMLLEEKQMQDITEEDLRSFTAVLMIVKDELEQDLGISSEELNNAVLNIVKNFNY